MQHKIYLPWKLLMIIWNSNWIRCISCVLHGIWFDMILTLEEKEETGISNSLEELEGHLSSVALLFPPDNTRRAPVSLVSACKIDLWSTDLCWAVLSMTAASFGADRRGGSRGETVSFSDPANDLSSEWAAIVVLASLAHLHVQTRLYEDLWGGMCLEEAEGGRTPGCRIRVGHCEPRTRTGNSSGKEQAFLRLHWPDFSPASSCFLASTGVFSMEWLQPVIKSGSWRMVST